MRLDTVLLTALGYGLISGQQVHAWGAAGLSPNKSQYRV
jgi:hypothetical protein